MSRMRPKKLSLLVVPMLMLAACNGAAEDPEGEEVGEPDPDAAAEDPDVSLELGHVWPDDDPQAQAVAEFADDVNELSGGSVTIEIFPASQLGGDREILEGLELGTNDLWVGGAGVYNAMSDVGLLYVVPFMFDDVDGAMEAYDGDLGEEVSQRIMDETDTRVLAHWPRGPRHLSLNQAAETPDSLQGARIRVPENPMFIETWRRLGASPTPMEFPEVFTALQQGTIDGQENPLGLTYTSGFAQVQSHMNLTAHVIEPLAVSIGNTAWDGLTENQQAALEEAAQGQARDNFRQVVEEEEEEFRVALEEDGMEIVEPDIEAYRQQVDGLVEEEFPQVQDLYETATS
jgi:TRAP-type transport system periplasmic protein